jgi:CHAD domain-containing protein
MRAPRRETVSMEMKAAAKHASPLRGHELALRLEADLAHRESLFVAAAHRVRERDDPEALHDLRVTSRRLSESLRLWRAVLDARQVKRVRRRLRRLRREAGPIRELEATLELVRSYERSLGPEAREALRPFVRRLRWRIEEGRRHLAGLSSQKRVGKILEGLIRARLPLRERFRNLPDPLLEARRRARQQRRLSIRLASPLLASATQEAFHAARIAIKKDRYAEECWIEVETSRDPARAAHLQALQRALGALRDHEVLESALETYALDLAAHGHLSLAREVGPLREAVRRGRTQAFASYRRLASGRRSKARLERAPSRAGTKDVSADAPPKLRAVHPPARRPGS